MGCSPPERITVHTFTLATIKGESVFQEQSDRRRLADAFERLTFKFHAFEKHFEFAFERRSIFSPNAIVRTAGNVRECNQVKCFTCLYIFFTN